MAVRRFDGLDTVEIFGMGIAVFRLGSPLQVPFGHRRIESLPVVKGNPFSQVDGIDHAVGRDVPPIGQAGEKPASAVHLDQSFVDVGVNDPVNGCSGIGRGIQSGGSAGWQTVNVPPLIGACEKAELTRTKERIRKRKRKAFFIFSPFSDK